MSHAPPQSLACWCCWLRPRPMSTRSSSNRRCSAERVAKMRGELRRERDAIAALRAEWATLEQPGRIQALAQRHLPLRPARRRAIRPARQAAGAAAELVPPAPTIRSARSIETLADPAALDRQRAQPEASRDERGAPQPLTRRNRRRPAAPRAVAPAGAARAAVRQVDRTPRRAPGSASRCSRSRRSIASLPVRLVDLRGGAGQPGAARRARRRGRYRAARHPRSQRRDARDRRARRRRCSREPQQADRRRRGGRAAHRRDAGPRRQRGARAARQSQARLRLAQARDHAEAAAGDLPARHARHRLSQREQARLSERRRGRRT